MAIFHHRLWRTGIVWIISVQVMRSLLWFILTIGTTNISKLSAFTLKVTIGSSHWSEITIVAKGIISYTKWNYAKTDKRSVLKSTFCDTDTETTAATATLVNGTVNSLFLVDTISSDNWSVAQTPFEVCDNSRYTELRGRHCSYR